jgi:thiol-disulfide isomerase/thioredoxin
MMRILLVMLFMLWMGETAAQTAVEIKIDAPETGKQYPDFTLRGIEHFSRKNATLDDFKGKWLILDFWNKNCEACIASFPRTNALQKEFAGKVQFLLVGVAGTKDQKNIRNVYERFRKRYDLDLPVVYDSALADQMKVRRFPQVNWVDDKGVFRATTAIIQVEYLEDYIAGKNPSFENSNERKSLYADFSKPLFVNGNGGADSPVYIHSALTGWRKELTTVDILYNQPIGFVQPNNLLITNSPLYRLYLAAYGDTVASYMSYNIGYGKWKTGAPLLELKDSSLFQYNYDTGKGLYCYNLFVPIEKANKKMMQQVMRSELKNYFGFDACVEKRIMPYWRLIATPEAKVKLRTKGGQPSATGSLLGVKLTNKPMSWLIDIIWAKNQNEPFFSDETGIAGNIDLDLNCLLTDFSDLKNELKKNGLQLLVGEKDMNVIVIRDPK